MNRTKAYEVIKKYRQKSILTAEDEFIYIEALNYMIHDTKSVDFMVELGSYYYGKQIYDQALKYYEMADTYGDTWAAEGLGYIWYYGRTGTIDYEKAFHYYSKAAKNGNLKSEIKVADMYKNGYDSRIAFGALCIQKKLDLADAETVEMIQENPYLQYFLGYHEYSYDKLFDSSTMVYFRKRFPEDVMNDINEHHFKDRAGGNGSGSSDSEEDESDTGSDDPKNSGTLIIDATCAPADIAYPTDLELADKARGWTEDIFDYLYLTQGNYMEDGIKPRTYCEVARHRFLNLNKRNKKSQKQIRKDLRYQLNCIERNIGYINH